MLFAATVGSLLCATLAAAQGVAAPDLVGTWASKANKTMTGPGFYDPVNEKLIEPDHTGISYSFTEDGFYETAYYRAIPNPVNPACPRAIMQWQHGKWTKFDNGSVFLEPFAVDGRQLLSDPCSFKTSLYTRYNQTELFQRYESYIDPYHNIKRINLFKFDGSPLMPMYMAYNPPMMLPTQTLNPTNTPTASGGAQATGKASRFVKRGGILDFEDEVKPMNHKVMNRKRWSQTGWADANRWWWFGLFMTGVGSVLYFWV